MNTIRKKPTLKFLLAPPYRINKSVSFCVTSRETREGRPLLCREGLFLLPYNELAVAQGPKIYQKNEL